MQTDLKSLLEAAERSRAEDGTSVLRLEVGTFSAAASAYLEQAASPEDLISLRDMLDRAVELWPLEPAVFVARGNLMASMDRPHNAADEYLHATEDAAAPPEAWLGAVEAYLAGGQPEEAAFAQLEVAEALDNNIAAWLRAGELCMAADDPVRAAEAYETVLEMDENNAAARLGRGEAALALDAPEDAVEDLRAAVTHQPDHAPAWRLLAEALVATDDFADALAVLDRALELDPDDAVALVLRADQRWMHDDVPGALADLTAAVAAAPESADPHLALADLHFALGEFEPSLNAAQTAMELEPEDPAPVRAAARALIGLERITEARSLLDAALERMPGESELYLERAGLLLRSGLNVLALRDAGWALEGEPSSEAYTVQGQVFLALSDFDQAVDSFDAALEIDEGDPQTLAWRGFALHHAGELDAAAEDWAAAEAGLDDDDPLLDVIEALRNSAAQ